MCRAVCDYHARYTPRHSVIMVRGKRRDTATTAGKWTYTDRKPRTTAAVVKVAGHTYRTCIERNTSSLHCVAVVIKIIIIARRTGVDKRNTYRVGTSTVRMSRPACS